MDSQVFSSLLWLCAGWSWFVVKKIPGNNLADFPADLEYMLETIYASRGFCAYCSHPLGLIELMGMSITYVPTFTLELEQGTGKCNAFFSHSIQQASA